MKKYYKPQEIADELGIHVNTVYKRMNEMKPFIGYGREYPPSTAVIDDKTFRVDIEAYMDFCNRRYELCEK